MNQLSETEQTKLYLLEVIDECVFVERQRELSERRYATQIEREKRANFNLITALGALLHYNTILEREVLVPSICLLPQYKSVFSKLLDGKRRVGVASSLVADEPLKSSLDAFLMKHTDRNPSSSDACSAAQTVDQIVDGVSQIVERLIAKEEHLAGELEAVHTALQSTSAQQEDALRAELREMKTRVDELQHYISAKSFRNGDCAASLLQSGEMQGHGCEQEARMKSLEMTVAALNAELASLQYSSQRDLQLSARTIEDLRKAQEEERSQQDQLQKENDAVLNRLANEMEQLISENVRLKAQLTASSF
ncbi:hypothetical protein STCU_05617 [Strigomonas culicis]|uniref:Uncharacterized protein n=1 Tax=Strigomonas culicis TaxID=28005 RepID=S9TW95_9TRYP|nr:hypothetical protein STCU_08793 [Strigomonas culicis]EPY27705.1 hypothetical protein STCU_05617 [Strigomonas culicis]|eukprot:EPY20873.1 hypothetical protein STCU_08793 [Strigomonas culicis]